MKLYLHSPKAAGRPLVGKRSRKHESSGFQKCEQVEQVDEPGEADALYFRNIPESTTDSIRSEMVALADSHPGKTVINHPAHMHLHDAKDCCFEAWLDADVPTPAFSLCEGEEAALEFATQAPHFLLRINNESCGDDTSIFHNASEREIRKTFRRLQRRARRLVRSGRGDTRIVAVALVGERDAGGLASFYRVFMVGSRIFGGYALVSHDEIVHTSNSCCSTPAEVDSFLRCNAILDELSEDAAFQGLAARAMKALELDVACLDFVMDRGTPSLLEANALWSPSFAWSGGKAGEAAYRADAEAWSERAKGYCGWMERGEFYRRMYALFPELLG